MHGSLQAITVENYRSFKEPFRLELRPLTLVYGWNNAGKSAVVRLVKLLGDSLRDNARAPLDPIGGPIYRDLVWKPAITKPGPLRFGLEWREGDPTRADWRFDYDRDASRMYVRELEIIDAAGAALLLRANRVGGEDVYRRDARPGAPDALDELHLRFAGLVPKSEEPSIKALTERLLRLRGSCHWLSGDRGQPPKFVAEGKPAPTAIDADGGGATEMLLADDALFNAVRAWYARPEIRRRLERKVQEATARLLLNPADAGFEVDLVDTGAGMGQVLPVLTTVAQAQGAARAGNEALVAIEEPESQLHPNAQRALGEWLCQVAGHDPAPRLVLETHSRVLILTIQVAIASGQLDPSRVAVYWLDQREDGSTASRCVKFDKFGRPGEEWPKDVFADELELADKLSEQQFANGAWESTGG
jgi:hypothetical protein